MIPGSVHVAYIHGNDVAAPFHLCMTKLLLHDLRSGGRIMAGGMTPSWCGSSVIPQGRNNLTRAFLKSPAEWYFQIDADMAFRPSIVDEMVAVAEAEDVKVLGGLAFAWKIGDYNNDFCTPEARVEPTIYAFAADGSGFVGMDDYPHDTLIEVGATGGACLLIHRSVMETLRDKHGEVWWSQLPFPMEDRPDNMVAEDISFCIRATTAGFPVHVHTGIQTQHAKHAYLSHEMYQAQLGQPQPPVPTYAIIPVKDNWPMTRDLLAQLAGHVDGVFVYDNGSSTETKARLREQSIADVFPADGLGIHEMWQAGVEEARERSPKCNLLILNNDIRLGDGAVEAMAAALRSDQRLAAVCPNYDGRPGEGIEKLHSICANRYDGTGGLAGFAFMVKGEFFDSFTFPLDAMWWYGDNLLTLAIDRQGGWYGMVHDATVEHLDGGGKTGDWDAYAASEQHTRDLEAFKKAAAELGIGVEFEAAS